ncbi:hypothetical protein OKW21_005191 [Catalinimonas alkaloidigena]|uniref:VCBS repeat-containing protein n=1 Tax=Catalinimonas alkaloidigena TaxID=1075417 RepID=UPI002406CA7C|nr:VCBS repeat-containing protein [Catalinimonas alkaloidigena]MDF9799928.1 hypothetical protein [Catalinimonas alkaloidigena]
MNIPCVTFLLLISFSTFAQQSWRMHTIDSTSFGADGTKLYHANEDNFADIICGWEQGNIARLYLNPANTELDWPFVEVPAPQVEDALLADLDEDGFADIVTLSEGKQQRITFHWAPADQVKYEQSEYWRSVDVPSTIGKTRWMFGMVMDVDGKNGLDLVVGSKDPNATLGWLEAPADPRDVAAWQFHEISPAGWIMSILSLDMDNDGWRDVLISDRYGDHRGVRWLKNPGNTQALKAHWKSHTIGLEEGEPMFLTHTEAGGIYAPDLKAGLLHFQRSAAGRWQADTIAYPDIAGSRGKAVSVGDINQDGTEDIALSFEGAENKNGVIWRDGKTQQFHPISSLEGIKYDLVVLIDMDQDSDLDVLTSEENNNSASEGGLGVVWYENPTY